MKIALDYDHTFTADPDFWRLFIEQCDKSGHEVRIVTARDVCHDRTQRLVDIEKFVIVVYCRGIAKKWFMTHFGDGFIPDIWIDDKPESILENSSVTPEKLVEWRNNRSE